ncbi:DUF3574 domain-containing protein [Hydrogenophaga palleronii]|uniref:DUF3574 domain-containing protein n=1 Tax=Hydrogenophaga palleronii TaxID=65655 RepID=UPI0008264620|nr:DUF3574 domain-containing protein [Hydrogenophaga palleronii]
MALGLSVVACSGLQRCASGQQAMLNSLLYFGTAQPTGVVSDEQWQAFVNDSIVLRFPDGFTVWPATGQWRDAAGQPVREASFVLNLVHPANDETSQALKAITARYKERFQQEAVLHVQSGVCVAW